MTRRLALVLALSAVVGCKGNEAAPAMPPEGTAAAKPADPVAAVDPTVELRAGEKLEQNEEASGFKAATLTVADQGAKTLFAVVSKDNSKVIVRAFGPKGAVDASEWMDRGEIANELHQTKDGIVFVSKTGIGRDPGGIQVGYEYRLIKLDGGTAKTTEKFSCEEAEKNTCEKSPAWTKF
ncbi:MAG TPA: hypothetical protein VGM90_36715 [Kofleriaceae bacterium]